MKPDVRDFVAGIAITAVGLVVALYASSQYQMGTAAQMGPGYFPTLLGSLMAFVGLVITLLSFKQAVHAFQPPPFTLRPLLAVVAAVGLFAFLVMRIGLIPTTVVTVVVTASASSSFQLRKALILGVSLSIVAWLIFSVGLQMTLPIFAWEF